LASLLSPSSAPLAVEFCLPLPAVAVSLTPPPIVVELPLPRDPSPRDECEFERVVFPDLLEPCPRDRREEFELAEDGREG
jgi:hypothetical protein